MLLAAGVDTAARPTHCAVSASITARCDSPPLSAAQLSRLGTPRPLSTSPQLPRRRGPALTLTPNPIPRPNLHPALAPHPKPSPNPQP